MVASKTPIRLVTRPDAPYAQPEAQQEADFYAVATAEETTVSKTEAKKQTRTVLKRYLRQYGGTLRLPASQHYGYAAKDFWSSVGFALEGLGFALREERNLRIDLLLSLLTIVAGVALQLPLHEWVPVIIAIGMVLFAELANTIMEWLVDLMTGGRYDLRAKRIKDMAAGACLIMALSSFAIIAITFWPHVRALLG